MVCLGLSIACISHAIAKRQSVRWADQHTNDRISHTHSVYPYRINYNPEWGHTQTNATLCRQTTFSETFVCSITSRISLDQISLKLFAEACGSAASSHHPPQSTRSDRWGTWAHAHKHDERERARAHTVIKCTSGGVLGGGRDTDMHARFRA